MDYNLIKRYYDLKLFNDDDLTLFVENGWITSAQKLQIMVDNCEENMKGN